MKKIVIFIAFLGLFLGCNSPDLKRKKHFYPSGALKTIYYETKKGSWEGVCKVYFESGELEQVKYFKNDKLNGRCFVYDKNGTLRKKCNFKDDLEVDTSFFFRENGSLEVYSIYNQNSEELKNVFFHPNGKLKKKLAYMIGSGNINAFKSYTEKGELKIKQDGSKFVRFKTSTDNEIIPEFIGIEYPKHDSIIVRVVKSLDFDNINNVKELRKMEFKKIEDVKFKLVDSDYVNGKASLSVGLYTGESATHVFLQEYKLQFFKGKPMPKDNLHPIYRK